MHEAQPLFAKARQEHSEDSSSIISELLQINFALLSSFFFFGGGGSGGGRKGAPFHPQSLWSIYNGPIKVFGFLPAGSTAANKATLVTKLAIYSAAA